MSYSIFRFLWRLNRINHVFIVVAKAEIYDIVGWSEHSFSHNAIVTLGSECQQPTECYDGRGEIRRVF